MTSLKKSHYFTVHIYYFETKINKNQTYQYEHNFMLLVLIYFNLFRKVFSTQIHVPQIESL